MKMVFSANQRGIPRNNIQPSIKPESQSMTLFTSDEAKTTLYTNNKILRLGMLARIQNTSDCSSCGK